MQSLNDYFVTFDSNSPASKYVICKISKQKLNETLQSEKRLKYPDSKIDRIICTSTCVVDNIIFSGHAILKHLDFEKHKCNWHANQIDIDDPVPYLKKEAERRMITLRDEHDKYSELREIGMIYKIDSIPNYKNYLPIRDGHFDSIAKKMSVRDYIYYRLPEWVDYKINERKKFRTFEDFELYNEA